MSSLGKIDMAALLSTDITVKEETMLMVMVHWALSEEGLTEASPLHNKDSFLLHYLPPFSCFVYPLQYLKCEKRIYTTEDIVFVFKVEV